MYYLRSCSVRVVLTTSITLCIIVVIQALQLQRRNSVMAESRRNDNKRKIEALEDEEVQKVREIAEKTAQDQAGLRRRLDALDKCTLLVVENSAKIEH